MFLIGPFVGPLVGLFGAVIGYEPDPPGYCLATALPLLGMIASHPLYPRWRSGLLTGCGLFIWVLLGLNFIHQAGG